MYTQEDIAEAKAEAWDEGMSAGHDCVGAERSEGCVAKNPYRHEKDGEQRYGVPCCWGKDCTTNIVRRGNEWYRLSNGDKYLLPIED